MEWYVVLRRVTWLFPCPPVNPQSPPVYKNCNSLRSTTETCIEICCRPSWTCVLFHVVIIHSLPSLGRILLGHFFLLPHHPTESSSCVLLQQQQYKPNACCDWIAKAVYLMKRRREEDSGEPNIVLLDCKGYVHRKGKRILRWIGYGSWYTN